MKQFLTFVAAIIVLGLIIEYWTILVLILVVIAAAATTYPLVLLLGKMIRDAHTARQERAVAARDERARSASRAKVEHQWYPERNPQGVYGQYPPVDLDTPQI